MQSSTCLLPAAHGEIPTFDAAVFADTGWEPQAVYRHLARLTRIAESSGIPVVRVSTGDIRTDALDLSAADVPEPQMRPFLRRSGNAGPGLPCPSSVSRKDHLQMIARDHRPIDKPSGHRTDNRSDDVAAWTAGRIRALGLTTDLTTAARIFGLSRAAAYDLAKRDQFPVTVLRFGSRYRVPVAAILHALHLPVGDDEPPGCSPP